MKITSIASSYFCENRIVGKTKTISNNLNNNISFKSTHYSLGQGEIEFDPIISKTYTGEKDSYAKSVNTTRVYLKDGATINNLKIRNTFCTYYTPNCPHVPNCICQPDIVLVDNATVNNYLDDKGSILFICEKAIPSFDEKYMNKKLVKYWLKGNFNISEPIKGSSIISSDSACAHIITGEWMYLNDNCHIDKAYAYRQVEIKDSAIVNGLNLAGEGFAQDNCKIDRANVGKEFGIYGNVNIKTVKSKGLFHASDNTHVGLIDGNIIEIGENAKIENVLNSNNIKISGAAQIEKAKSDKITMNYGAVINNMTTNFLVMENDSKCENIDVKNNAILKNKSSASKIVSAGEIALYDDASVGELKSKKISLNDRAKVDNIVVEDCITIKDSAEVGNIIVTGVEQPKVIIEENAKIHGTIKFLNSHGSVLLKRGEDRLFPYINESQIINGEIDKLGVKTGFDKVAGMHELIKTLKEDVIEPLRYPELYKKYGLKPINGILLYGPPGCGKTFIANSLAEESGRYFVNIKMSDIGSEYQNLTVQNLKEKFELAKANAPSIVFLDEVEALAPDRATLANSSNEVTERVTELLTQLNNCAENNIFVICASNEPQKIDKAIKRTGRMDKKIYVGPPDKISRQEMIKMQIKDRFYDKNVDLDLIGKNTQNYLASDLKVIIDQAAKYALRDRRPISTEHFMRAISAIKPSLSESEIECYKNKIQE